MFLSLYKKVIKTEQNQTVDTVFSENSVSVAAHALVRNHCHSIRNTIRCLVTVIFLHWTPLSALITHNQLQICTAKPSRFLQDAG